MPLTISRCSLVGLTSIITDEYLSTGCMRIQLYGQLLYDPFYKLFRPGFCFLSRISPERYTGLRLSATLRRWLIISFLRQPLFTYCSSDPPTWTSYTTTSASDSRSSRCFPLTFIPSFSDDFPLLLLPPSIRYPRELSASPSCLSDTELVTLRSEVGAFMREDSVVPLCSESCDASTDSAVGLSVVWRLYTSLVFLP